MEEFDFSKLTKPFSANDIGGKLPDIPDSMTKGDTLRWVCDSVCDWIVNNATRQKDYYKPLLEIKNSEFGSSLEHGSAPVDHDALIASLGDGRFVRVRRRAVFSWYQNSPFMPEFVCGGYSAGYLDFVLREWIEVGSEQKRFQKSLESDFGWQFFLQNFQHIKMPDLGDDGPIILSPEEVQEIYMKSELTKVGITPTPSILKYAHERLEGKTPDQCQTSPMMGVMVTSFLVTHGISRNTNGYKEFLAQTHQHIDVSGNIFPTRLFSRIQKVFAEHRAWIKENLELLTPRPNCFLTNINLQDKMPGRSKTTDWDVWINEYLTSPKMMTYVELLSLCEENELKRKQFFWLSREVLDSQAGENLDDSMPTELNEKDKGNYLGRGKLWHYRGIGKDRTQAIQTVQTLLTTTLQITANTTEMLRTRKSAETTRNLAFHLEHTKIALGFIVRKRNRQIEQETNASIVMLIQTIKQTTSLATLLHP